MIKLESASQIPSEVQAIGFGVFSQGSTLEAGDKIDVSILKQVGFEAKLGQTYLMSPGQGSPVSIAIGLGDKSKFDLDALRKSGAAFIRASKNYTTVAIEIDLVEDDFGPQGFYQALGEGVLLGSYSFDTYRSNSQDNKVEKVFIKKAPQQALQKAELIAEAVYLARDLVNEPAGKLSPSHFAEIAQGLANEVLEVQVWDEQTIKDEKLGGVLAVSRGSFEPPRLIKMEYKPPTDIASVPSVVLVGKGITFDSGGLSLKSAEGMMTMKTDMSGGAAVVGAMSALAKLSLPVHVIAIVPVTENMPGGRATKPGDVFRARNGKTIEVLNTDAEGRLILADGLSLASEINPDAIIDLATLTGACVVALGREIAGVMGNNQSLVDQILKAAHSTGEACWQLPLPSQYRKHIESEIADMKNIGASGGQAGTLSAALLLEEFVGEQPWAHLDIAGPARSDNNEGYWTKGGSGFGVRLLIDLFESFTVPVKD